MIDDQLTLEQEQEARLADRAAAMSPAPVPSWDEQHVAAAERARHASQRESIESRFRRFDAEHPEVYEHFRRIASRLRRRGAPRLGGRNIWEAMRYRYTLAGVSDDFGVKLNDHFPPHYVRKLIADDPTFEPYFEVRHLRAP